MLARGGNRARQDRIMLNFPCLVPLGKKKAHTAIARQVRGKMGWRYIFSSLIIYIYIYIYISLSIAYIVTMLILSYVSVGTINATSTYHLVQFGLLRSISIHFSSIGSTLVSFSPYSPLHSISVLFGLIKP